MGKVYQADVPGNYFHQVFTNASVASTADALVASQAFVAPQNIKVKRAWYTPWADQATTGTATSSASYRRINLLNGGTSGTETTIIASCNMTASVGSITSKAFTTTSNNTVTSGGILYFSALTVGGDDDNTSTLQSGVLEIEYELL